MTYNFQIGTILEGTIAVNACLSATLDVLAQIDSKRAMAFHNELGGIGIPMDFGGACLGGDVDDWGLDVDEMEAVWEIRHDAVDAVSELCPPYMYFGTHPDDPACLGFWPCWDAIDMAHQDGELITYGDRRDCVLRELPTDYTGDFMYINDHGNVTLGRAINGESVETYWDCV